jgi:hypothetical protein
MKRLAATLALGLLVALLVGTGVASAAGNAGQDSATGRVTDATMITFIPQPPICVPPFGCTFPPDEQVTTTADVDFSARSSYNGTNPTGSARFTFRNEDPDQVFTGEVTCLNVQGGFAFASLSGPITEARGGSTLRVGPQAFEPRSFLIQAQDFGRSGRPQHDVIGFKLSPEPATDATCTTEFTQTSQVREGEVVIKDSLG